MHEDIFEGMPTFKMEVGDVVVCDLCNKDYTNSPQGGGLKFASLAVGPCCEKNLIVSVTENDEREAIKGRCPPDKSFADWVREDLR